jgi:hypothetical protein
VLIDGEEREIIIIRDFSDSVAIEKLQLTHQEDNALSEYVSHEINIVFSKHCNIIDKVILT